MIEKSAISIGRVRVYRNLAVAPVYASDDFRESVLMLDEAMRRPGFSVTESGEVKSLVIENRLDDKVFIACGTLIEGQSQNRYSKFPTLVLPRTRELYLPVNCAQERQGLIRGSRGKYNISDTVVMSSIRGGDVDQRSAWGEIAHTTVFLRSMDPTRDYKDAERRADIDGYKEAIGNPEDGQIGIVAGIKDGERALFYTDFFGNNEMLRKLHQKLAKSFGIVARVRDGNAGSLDADDLAGFLRKIEVMDGQRVGHVGGGNLYVIDNPVKGSALSYENSIVQVTMRQDYN